MLHLHVNLSCVPHCFFPAKCVFSAFYTIFFWKVTFKRLVIPTLINRVKCYISVQEIWGCDSNSAFTTVPSAAGTPLFMFLATKNAQKDQCKISLETYFCTVENAVVLCKNLGTEGEIHFVVAHAVSLATSEGSDLWSVVLCGLVHDPCVCVHVCVCVLV